MKPALHKFGKGRQPVVVIDDFSGDPERISRIAETMAPFPVESDSYYPGVRGKIDEEQPEAFAYARAVCADAGQFIAGAFGIDSFDLLRASFSMVTTDPAQLSNRQRTPHFDSTDPKYLAILHYLRVPAGSGTAFYRQRKTAIERVTDTNLSAFIRSAEASAASLPPDSGYILGSNEHYEQIGAVEAVPDRLIIYQGNLLHSGIIPPTMPFSADPREGRLTANLFVRGN